MTNIRLGYAYINQNHETETEILKSLYALEYLRHKAVFGLDHKIWSKPVGVVERKMAATDERLSSVHESGLQGDVERPEI